jgi:hypothetical protein
LHSQHASETANASVNIQVNMCTGAIVDDLRTANRSLARDMPFATDTFAMGSVNRRVGARKFTAVILASGANFAILSEVSSDLALFSHGNRIAS